jgi:predicted MFS family arabinose efflux permease
MRCPVDDSTSTAYSVLHDQWQGHYIIAGETRQGNGLLKQLPPRRRAGALWHLQMEKVLRGTVSFCQFRPRGTIRKTVTARLTDPKSPPLRRATIHLCRESMGSEEKRYLCLFFGLHTIDSSVTPQRHPRDQPETGMQSASTGGYSMDIDSKGKDRAVTASIFVLGALLNASLLCAPALANQLASELHFTPQYVGNFFSIEFLGYALAGILSTYAITRYKWRKIAVVGLAIFIVGNLLSPYFGHDIAALFTLRAITATAGCLINVICLAAAGRTSNPSRTYGFFVIGQLLFGVAGLAILPMIFEHGGIANYYRIIAALSALALLGAVPFLPSGGAVQDAVAPVAVVRTSKVWVSALAFIWGLLFYISLSGVWTFVGSIGQTLGLNPEQTGRTLSIATVAGIVGSASAAWIGSRGPRIALINFGFACMLVSVGAFVVPANGVVFFIATLGFKFAWTFLLPFVFSVVSNSDHTGRLFALVCVSIGVGLAIGPTSAGFLVTRTGGFTLMLAASCAVCAAAWMSVLLLSRGGFNGLISSPTANAAQR